MRDLIAAFLALTFVLAGCTAPGPGPSDGDDEGEAPDVANVMLQRVATDLDQPLGLTHAGDGRLFVVEQPGTIRILADGSLQETPFLDIRDRVGDAGFEQGLLGLAFPGDHADSGRFYVAYTDTVGDSVLARYRVDPDDPDRALPDSEEVLLEVSQPFPNHNGGHLAFGPDGYLYHGLGDGGAAGDPQQQGQNPGTLLGSMLRIDVDTSEGYDIPEDNPFVGDPSGRDEVWAYGLRNPWRWSFDPATGDLYIADVGQDRWEEVNVQPSGSSGGENYGWNVYEGEEKYVLGPPQATAPDAVFPVAVYSIEGEDCSVTGGHVYRGSTLPGFEGRFVFGDYCTGKVWLLEETDDGWTMELWREMTYSISAFGTDEDGELYLVHHEGDVYRFVPDTGA